ncbi:MAG: TrmH family RNA methyltransferase [Chloroflexota bacterium]
MLRTAWAAGVAAVMATPATTDLWSPKALRAGMGAQFHLPLTADWPLREQVLVAQAGEGAPYWTVDWARPTALIVGSEAHGASSQAAKRASGRVTIPMEPGMESVNAAAATAVLLFHARRASSGNATPGTPG